MDRDHDLNVIKKLKSDSNIKNLEIGRLQEAINQKAGDDATVETAKRALKQKHKELDIIMNDITTLRRKHDVDDDEFENL